MTATIAVHVGSDVDCHRRLHAAAYLSRHIDAKLLGLYTDFRTALSEACEHPGAQNDALQDRLEPTAVAMGMFFTEAMRSCHVAQFRHIPDMSVDAFMRHARYADVLVISQVNNAVDQGAQYGASQTEALVLASGRPVLVLPGTGDVRSIGKRVLVCWDEGKGAARALFDAAPIIRCTKELIMLTVRPSGQTRPLDARHARDLTAYCCARGYPEPRFRLHCSDEEGLVHCLNAAAAAYGCDLIAMGAYGHLREGMIRLGSLTRAMIRTTTLPLLLSH